VDEVILGQQLPEFWWTQSEWVRPFGIFGGRIESGAGSSGFLVDKMRV
jgi:hypothetical protein